MKKEILTCDMCGGIIRGPGDMGLYHVEEVEAVVSAINGYKVVYNIDVCEDDIPTEHFDGETIKLLFGGGTTHPGEIIELQDQHVVAVIEISASAQTVTTHAPDDLDEQQRKYVDRAADAIQERHQKELNNTSQYGRDATFKSS